MFRGVYRCDSKINTAGARVETIRSTGEACKSDAGSTTVCACGCGATAGVFGVVHFEEVAMTGYNR